MEENIKEVSLPTMKRLPYYYQYLKRLQGQGREVVSCSNLAEGLNVDATQVRKDLSVTGVKGSPKIGYPVSSTITAIEKFMNWDNMTDAFLVGAGNLGRAILSYEGFKQYGLKIVAAFDIDEKKTGHEINGIKILHLEKLKSLAQRMHIHLGVITVPAEQAQSVADLMVSGGIKAIWNFAPINLDLPESIIVQNENLACGLGILTREVNRIQIA
ncbi:MAG: redox-sensing transcriptional repressor Rex [Candidatus Eremiobacterota bacterium]